MGGSAGIGTQDADTVAQAATDYVNSVGGVHGRPLKVITCDDQGTPETVTACANQFVAAHVSIVGVRNTTNEAALLTPLQAAGIPVLMSFTATQTAFTSPIVFSVSAGALQALTLPAVYGKDHGLKSNATILVNTASSGAIANTAKNFFAKAGMTFTTQLVNNGTPDLTGAVTAALQSKPDTLSILGSETFCLSGLKAARSLGYKGAIFFGGCNSDQFIKSAGSDLDGTFTAAVGSYIGLSADDQAKYSAALKKFAPNIDPLKDPKPAMFAEVALIAEVMNKQMPASSDFSSSSVLAAFKGLKDFHYPFDGGIPLTCDGKQISFIPSACSAKIGYAKFENGKETNLGTIDYTSVFN